MITPSSLARSTARMLTASSLVFLLCSACGSAPDAPADKTSPTLRFSAIPDQNTTETQEKLAPLVDHLSQVLGVDMEYVPSRDYQASVEMFKNGDVHLAWFGGLTGVQARDQRT